MKKIFDLFVLWRSARIVLVHYGVLAPYAEQLSQPGNPYPVLVAEKISHEELIIAFGGCAFAVWDFFNA